MSTLQLVNRDRSTLLFDFSDPEGDNNAFGVRTRYGRGNKFNLGKPPTRYVSVSSDSQHGGRIVRRTDPLTTTAWTQRFEADDLGDLLFVLNDVSHLLATGECLLKWSPDGSDELTGYCSLEPSDQLAAFVGNNQELLLALRDTLLLDVEVAVTRQPYLEYEYLDPETNLLTNGTLNGLPILRGYAWDDVTGITAQSIDPATWTYSFTIANAAAHNLRQTTAVASVAVGAVAPLAFDTWVDAVVGTPKMQAVVEYMRADGTTAVGAAQTGTLVTLTRRPQRIFVTPAASGALTSRARVSLRIDNVDASSVRVHLRCAQAEIGAAPTLFIAAPEPVAFDPEDTSQASRTYATWIHGSAPTNGGLRSVSDAKGLQRVIVHRETRAPGYVAAFPLHKSLNDGTLGADTTSIADADAVGGTVAKVTYTSPDPTRITGSVVHGAGDTIVIPKPADIGNGPMQIGDHMEAWIFRSHYRTKVTAPRNWKLIPDPQFNRANDHSSFSDTLVLWGFHKFADADDLAAVDFTFSVLGSEGESGQFVGAITVRRNINQLDPLESIQFLSQNNDDQPKPPSVTPEANGAAISIVIAGVGAAGSLAFDAPPVTGVTLTEVVDQTADVTFHGLAIYTGVMATAVDSATQKADASIPIDAVMAVAVWRKAPAGLATRSQVELANLQPGDWEMFMRYRSSGPASHRLSIEWATEPDPPLMHHLVDYKYDVSSASAFPYEARSFGIISIPEDYDLEALTIRVSSGLEEFPAAPVNLLLDHVWLAPANEQVGVMTATRLLTSGEVLLGDADRNKVYHLNAGGVQAPMGTAEGPVPMEYEPGWDLLNVTVLQDRLAGHLDRGADIDAAPMISTPYTRRERG